MCVCLCGTVSRSPEHLQQAALDEYGPDLHVALRSRREELLYLRKLTEMLFPYVIPPKAPECRYWCIHLVLLQKSPFSGDLHYIHLFIYF